MKRQKTDGLDRQISYRLTKALGDDGRADWLDVRERAGMSRTLWRWSQRRVLLVAGVLVLAVGAAGASTGIIPWLGEVPKPIPPTIYPICGANDVQARLYLHKSSQSRELSGSIALINTGDKLCALEGQPKVSLIGSGANSAPLQVEMFSPVAKLPKADKTLFGSGSPDQTLLGRSFEPPDRSSVSFGWENWCGSDSADLALRFEIANGSDFTLPVTTLPACVGSAKASRLVFGGAHGAPPPLGPNFPLHPKILPEIDGKSLVLEQGKVFRYRVALTNESSSPYRFGEDCPLYGEYATMGRFVDPLYSQAPFVSGSYILNCHSAGTVDPGETVTFAMELPATRKAFDAGGTLHWTLGSFTDQNMPPAKAEAPITVVGKPPANYAPSDVYSVFAPGRSEAKFPAEIERFALHGLTEYGPVVPGSRRILLKKGEPDGPAYAWTTESGSACFRTASWSSCDEGATETRPAAVGIGWGSVSPTIVSGVARDRVKRVDAVVNGELSHVGLKNNIVYAEFPNGSTVSEIVLTMDDGAKVKIKQGSQELAGAVPLR